MASVTVVPHDPDWALRYQRESRAIAAALGEAHRVSHHVGSTSIPGIHAKPIIDILISVSSIRAVDQRSDALAHLGYEARGEYGIAGRRFFRKTSAAGEKLFHIHAYTEESPELARYLAFRDYLRAHPRIAREYSALKQSLAARHPDDIESYMAGKDPFIKATEQVALAWEAK